MVEVVELVVVVVVKVVEMCCYEGLMVEGLMELMVMVMVVAVESSVAPLAAPPE